MFYYIPLFYSLVTRLCSKKSRLAWIFTYLLPVGGLLFSLDLFDFLHVYVFFICIFSTYSIYEVGYIYNDCELTKIEKNPTMRLSRSQLDYYERNKKSIYLFRFVVTFLTSFFVFYFDEKIGLALLLNNIIIFFVYILYNNCRSRLSIPLYSVLVLLRYFGLAFLFVPVEYFFLLWVTYPLCATLEFCNKEKYNFNLNFLLGDVDRFRVGYYLFFVLFFYFFKYYSFFEWKPSFLLLFYFFIYRVLSLFIASSHYRKG